MTLKLLAKLRPTTSACQFMRWGYFALGVAVSFVVFGNRVEERVRTVVDVKERVVYQDIDTSRHEQKEEQHFNPDGTPKSIVRYNLRTTRISKQGEVDRQEHHETEISKVGYVKPQYTLTGGMSLLGKESIYYTELGARVGNLPLFGTFGVIVPQNAFKLGETTFIIGVRYEF